LFSGEEITFDDICEAKTVTQGVMYLDFEGSEIIEQMRHVGRTGRFVPVVEGGGRLYRIKDNKHYAVTGTKDYSWVEASVAKDNQNYQLDDSYFITLVDKAKESINKFGNFEDFIS
jgi:hypothetical protein